MEFFDKKIRDYISSNIELNYEFNFEQFNVGRSNITYKIFDDTKVYAILYAKRDNNTTNL